MANLSPAVLVLILVVGVVVALLIGYFLGTRFGGKKSVAMKKATEQHDSYRSDVREHFEQTSAIMSRMVQDYRDMYEHLSAGAQQLADIQPEKRVTPPPAPEAITRDSSAEPAGDKTETPHTQDDAGQPKTTAAQEKSQPADTAAKTDEKSGQTANAGNAANAADKPKEDEAAKASAASGEAQATKAANDKPAAASGNESAAAASDDAQTQRQKKRGKKYGLE